MTTRAQQLHREALKRRMWAGPLTPGGRHNPVRRLSPSALAWGITEAEIEDRAHQIFGIGGVDQDFDDPDTKIVRD